MESSSQTISVFQGRQTPEEGYLAGYAQLISILEFQASKLVPLPERLILISKSYRRYETSQWRVFTKRYQPKGDIVSHVVFALKYEGVDLYILKALFQYTGASLPLEMINKEPLSQYTRRIWFLYEWLMRTTLDVPDLKDKVAYAEIVNPKLQYPGPVRNSTRHLVKNNLPGTPNFCPLIRKTDKLESFINKNLDQKIEAGLRTIDKEVLKRTAAYLLLKDSKASFAIEGEYPPNTRARNWGKIFGQAGKNKLTVNEIERLQDIVIGSKKLKHMGIRKDVEGFIGEHDRTTFVPIPDHISARAKDLPTLLDGLMKSNELLQNSEYHPVLTASMIAFGFAFIHPLVDGNGRVHRYIFHHILSKMGFTKRDLIFPISAAILDRIGEYQEVLESYSSPRLELIKWETTSDYNTRIINETVDLYRYYDLTIQTEFLFTCMEDTIERIIPEELEYLFKYDQLANTINDRVSLPDSKVDLLIKLLNQNDGQLSQKKKQKLFDELSDQDIEYIESTYAEIFDIT